MITAYILILKFDGNLIKGNEWIRDMASIWEKNIFPKETTIYNRNGKIILIILFVYQTDILNYK